MQGPLSFTQDIRTFVTEDTTRRSGVLWKALLQAQGASSLGAPPNLDYDPGLPGRKLITARSELFHPSHAGLKSAYSALEKEICDQIIREAKEFHGCAGFVIESAMESRVALEFRAVIVPLPRKPNPEAGKYRHLQKLGPARLREPIRHNWTHQPHGTPNLISE